MTREQLDAIRARIAWLEEHNAYRPPELSRIGIPLVDSQALLAEVERLTAEVREYRELVDGLVKTTAEVEMLRGVGCMEDGDGPCGVCRKCAFRRGVAAMREAAAQRCEISPIHGEKTTTARKYADAVRAIPDPEDTP